MEDSLDLQPLEPGIQFRPEDLPILRELAWEAFQLYSQKFPPLASVPSDFAEGPIRWKVKISTGEFEFVISEMGSLTLRLAESNRYRRNPPPVFYASLGKDSEGNWEWQDARRKPLPILEEEGMRQLLAKADLSLHNQI